MRDRVSVRAREEEEEQNCSSLCPKRAKWRCPRIRIRRPEPHSQANFSGENGNQREEDLFDDRQCAEEQENQRREEDAVYEEQIKNESDDNCCSGMMFDQPIKPLEKDPIFWIVTDPEVFDCPFCFEPLTIPVFQCEEGHIVCSSCCSQTSKCAVCTLPIGYIRCRAIEKVIESIKIKCPNTKYGCNETVSYSLKHDHEKTCQYAPCSCPLLECNFAATSTELYQHFGDKHQEAALGFVYDKGFHITLNVKTKFIVLQEKIERELFILHNRTGSSENMIWISFISPSKQDGFLYNLQSKSDGVTIQRFQSYTRSIQTLDDNSFLPDEFLRVPSSIFGYHGQFKLYIRITKLSSRR